MLSSIKIRGDINSTKDEKTLAKTIVLNLRCKKLLNTSAVKNALIKKLIVPSKVLFAKIFIFPYLVPIIEEKISPITHIEITKILIGLGNKAKLTNITPKKIVVEDRLFFSFSLRIQEKTFRKILFHSFICNLRISKIQKNRNIPPTT